jgi:hypothetical protein
MPEKPRLPRAQVYHTGDYDHEQIERAREVVRFARKVLAESDPSILLRWRTREAPSDGQ